MSSTTSTTRRGGARRAFDAILLDLDGVITETARLHAHAWKDTFDAVLATLTEADGVPRSAFDEAGEYRAYVDGKARDDGVRSFLAARGISLPEGEWDDPPTALTVYGISNRKNQHFEELLAEEGVLVYEEVHPTLERWRAAGYRLAVVSSSKHCEEILRVAGLSAFFEERVDGVDRVALGLKGKPAPDTFLEAARRMDVEPRRAVVVEDALAGVEAGAAGGFGFVVGVARHSAPEPYFLAGAHEVVTRLDEIDLGPPKPEEAERGFELR